MKKEMGNPSAPTWSVPLGHIVSVPKRLRFCIYLEHPDSNGLSFYSHPGELTILTLPLEQDVGWVRLVYLNGCHFHAFLKGSSNWVGLFYLKLGQGKLCEPHTKLLSRAFIWPNLFAISGPSSNSQGDKTWCSTPGRIYAWTHSSERADTLHSMGSGENLFFMSDIQTLKTNKSTQDLKDIDP